MTADAPGTKATDEVSKVRWLVIAIDITHTTHSIQSILIIT